MNHTDYLRKIGLEIKIARIRQNMTQTDLANKTGLAQVTICEIEMGKGNSRILSYKRIAEALGVELKDVL